MTCVLTVVVVCLVTVQAAQPRGEEKYTSQYDNVDLQEIMQSERLFKSYQDCMLDKGPCTPDGKTLREATPDALTNECSKCTEKQKEGVKTIIMFLIKEKPEVWEELKKKYDPEGKYEHRYAHYLEEAKKSMNN